MVSVAKLSFERTGKPNRHAFHDVGLAMGNMLVQATVLDLFVHQMAGFLRKEFERFTACPTALSRSPQLRSVTAGTSMACQSLSGNRNYASEAGNRLRASFLKVAGVKFRTWSRHEVFRGERLPASFLSHRSNKPSLS